MSESYYVRGPIEQGHRVVIATQKSEPNSLNFLTFSGNEQLIFDPRHPADGIGIQFYLIGTVIKLTSNSLQISFEGIQAINGNKLGALIFGSGKIGGLAPSPITFTFTEETNLNIDGLRYEGRYKLKFGNTSLLWQFLEPDIFNVHSKHFGMAKTVVEKGALQVVPDTPIFFIPLTTYIITAGKCQIGNNDISKVLDDAMNFWSGGSPPHYFSTSDECSPGVWYDVCYKPDTCGFCFGNCSTTGNTCTYQSSSSRWGCSGSVTPVEPDKWWQKPWVLILIGIGVLTIIIIIVVLVTRKPKK